MKERISWLVNHAPKVSKEDIAAINDLFPAYIFRCRKTREIWTSCCGKHERLEKEHPVLKAEHRREPSRETIKKRMKAGSSAKSFSRWVGAS